FLSGDRHFSELLKYEQEGCYPLYEYTNSPLTSPVRKKPGKPGNPEYNNPLRVPGTQYNARNFGTIEISGPLDDRICTLRLFSKKGKLIWTHELKARELRFH
ncbi:MAG: hypothetical protein KAG66_23480, partial [Methylococcales bacterium]|nr:hypothetical protein [Methylococcales bacterium]